MWVTDVGRKSFGTGVWFCQPRSREFFVGEVMKSSFGGGAGGEGVHGDSQRGLQNKVDTTKAFMHSLWGGGGCLMHQRGHQAIGFPPKLLGIDRQPTCWSHPHSSLRPHFSPSGCHSCPKSRQVWETIFHTYKHRKSNNKPLKIVLLAVL